MWQSMSTGGKIGAVAGGLGGAAGVAAALAAVLSGPGDFNSKIGGLVVIIVLVLVVFTIFFLVFRKIFGPVGQQRKLQRTGIPADATILEVRETGWTVNQIYPVVKLQLEVRPPGRQPYKTEIQTIIGRLDVPQFQPGAVVPVKYDPRDPSKVALADTVPSCQTSSPPAQAMEEFLKRNNEESEEIRRTGKPAPAVVIQSTPLNVFVNGRNPAMTFILDVQPEGQPAFQAQVTGVILEASVPKYLPGKIVYVKYDPADLSRVSLDHS